MPAILTDKLKRQFLQVVYDEITDTLANYYVAIGHGEEWLTSDDTVPNGTPRNSIREEREFRLRAQSAKKVADVSFVIPRFNWSSGSIYSQYDDNRTITPGASGAANTNPYYVLTDENQVYICVKQPRDATGAALRSTVQPTGTSLKPFKTADGYTWKFLYGIGGAKASAFLSANFMPVEYVKTGQPGLNSLQDQQADVRDAAVPKQILGVELVTAGAGYTSIPTVQIVGNGDSVGSNTFTPAASASATIDSAGGFITKIEMDSSSVPGGVDSVAEFGRNYDYADVIISGGGATTDATARAVLHGNDSGLGANPVFDLRASSLMFNVKIEGGEKGADGFRDFVVDDRDYRQIAVFKRPRDYYGDLYTATTGRMMKSFRGLRADIQQLKSLTDPLITQSNGFTGIVGDIDSDTCYYYQNDSTGFTPLANLSINNNSQGFNAITPTHIIDSADIDPFSGEIIYVENRSRIQRTDTETNDIKIIVSL